MLRDVLTGPERDELTNVMLHEPLSPKHAISYDTIKSLTEKGLVMIVAKGKYAVCWERIKAGLARK